MFVKPNRVQFVSIFLFVAASTFARADYREFRDLAVSPELDAKVERAAEASLKKFPRLTPDNLALSVVDLSDAQRLVRADYHGDAFFYPASLVKLFFMVAAFHQDHFTLEIERALGGMIRLSDNDAAAFLVDVLTNTTSGPELEGKGLEDFLERRRSLNRYFSSLGYDVSVFLKPWSFGPFGRDTQIMGENKINRNRASANSVASLLLWIVRHRAISAQASDAMLALMERPLDPPRGDENQVLGFFGEALPPGARLWSKEGDTSEVRHDAAYVELRGDGKYIIVILTRGAADDKTLLPGIGNQLLQELAKS
jgi:beta-lactamase class A